MSTVGALGAGALMVISGEDDDPPDDEDEEDDDEEDDEDEDEDDSPDEEDEDPELPPGSLGAIGASPDSRADAWMGNGSASAVMGQSPRRFA